MLDYAICSISGKQYKVIPDQPFEVDLLNTLEKDIEADVLMISENGKVIVGTPYLKDKLSLKFLSVVKKDKIRVAKFHAKANFRRVTGNRTKKTRVVLDSKKD